MLNSPSLRLIAAALIMCTSPAFADTFTQTHRDTLNTLKQQASEDTLSYDIVESLTTEVGARLVGTPASDKSEQWAADKMRELGFDKVWLEESEATLWERGNSTVTMVAPYQHSLVALALGNSVGTGDTPIRADVVRFDSLDALKAAAPGSLKGKIAYVGFKMHRHIDGRGYGEAVGARVSGASEAAKKGAVAFILRSVGTDSHRVAHTGVMNYADDVKKIPALALSNPDADLLDNALKRDKPVTLSLDVGASGNAGTTTIANVIGEITGSKYPEQVVTLGAHLDSWDVGTGAIDDGLGVGITLAAAHYISQLEQRPERTIRVILFAAEEIGLAGAKDYVARRNNDMSNHVIGAEWDFGNGNIYRMEPGVGPVALNDIREFANYLAPMGIALAKTNTAKGQSDMSALGHAGQPAVNFNPDGSDYFDVHHTHDDTLDKVNKDALKHNTAVYTLFAYFAAASGVDFRK